MRLQDITNIIDSKIISQEDMKDDKISLLNELGI